MRFASCRSGVDRLRSAVSRSRITVRARAWWRIQSGAGAVNLVRLRVVAGMIARFALEARRGLHLAGRLPGALPDFLVDAHRLGALRQNGTVYQFRHSLLQNRLAERSDTPSRRSLPRSNSQHCESTSQPTLPSTLAASGDHTFGQYREHAKSAQYPRSPRPRRMRPTEGRGVSATPFLCTVPRSTSPTDDVAYDAPALPFSLLYCKLVSVYVSHRATFSRHRRAVRTGFGARGARSANLPCALLAVAS